MVKKIITLISLAFILMVISGCSSQTNTGVLELKITDAPAEFEIQKALVTISQVQVHKANSGENATNESESGWFTVVEETQTYDLMQLTNGVTDVLGTSELEVGKYTQIRLILERAVVTIDDVEHDLTVPSDKLKLTKGFTIEQNKTTTLTLDFDAKESIKANGKDEYKLNPTIKIIEE